jgi:hypothetical protein
MSRLSAEKLQFSDELLERLEKLVTILDPNQHDLLETVQYMNYIRLKMIERYHKADHQPEILSQINKMDSIIKYVLEMQNKQDVTSM